MRTEAPSPIDTSRGISRRDFLLKGLLGIFGVAAVAAFLKWGPFHLSSSTEGLVLPDTFSNEAKEGVMGDRNTILLSSKQAETVFPQQIVENRENYTATIPCPFQAPNGMEIKYTVKTFNPSTVSPMEVIGGHISWQNVNIRRYSMILPKETKIFAPIDANFYLGKVPDQNLLNGISLIYYDSKTNTTYKLYIWNQIYTKDQFNAAPFLQNRNTPGSIDDWEEYPTVEKGTFLMTTFQEQTSVDIFVDAFRGKEIGPKADLVEKKRRALSTQFATLNDKLLVIGNT